MSDIASNTVEVVENKSTMDERKVLARLVIQKVLSSDAAKYLAKDSFQRMHSLMLSEAPDVDFTLSFRLLEGRDSYYSGIAGVEVKWVLGQVEINDTEGNVWSTYTLNMVPSVGSSYSNSIEQFIQRAECMYFLKDLIEDIRSMVPGPIRVMTLDNEGRIARDKKKKYDDSTRRFASYLQRERKKLRVGLRVGGKPRVISRTDDILTGIEPGTYEFRINDGSNRSPRYKQYVIRVPDVAGYYATIKRIA